MAEKETENKGAAQADPNPSQGEGTQAATNLVDHVVTKLDLKHNPDLVEKGIKVGDKVQIPAEAKAKSDQREKEAKAEKAGKTEKGKEAKYVVASPFADRDNFSKMWNEGDDVSSFDEKRLKDCIERGLVKKA